MALIDLKTDLKSLQYGMDRKDGASSNQPYIVTPIPEGNAPTSPDFLLRNGTLNPKSSLTDVKRISRFFTDNRVGNLDFFPFQVSVDLNLNSINGLLFVAKQELLERQNVKVVNGFNRIYNPLGTIAQVGALSSGYHLNKQGFNVLRNGYFNGGKEGYFDLTNQNNTNDRNRLTLLYTIKTLQQRLTEPASTLYGITNPFDTTNLISYSGGPGSFLGIGKTNIRIQNSLRFFVEAKTEKTTATYSTNENIPATYLAPTAVNITKVYAKGYNRSFGSQTSFNRSRANSVGNVQTEYKLNPNLSISPDSDVTNDNDIVRFNFSLINNNTNDDKTSQPDTQIFFRAYIDDFGDSFTGEWDSYRYVGRGENFYKYKGFTRDMNLTFTVPALSRADMITNYQKLNTLVWATTPDYSEAGLMRGNLVKFTMGDYLNDAIVIIKSLNFSPITDMGWDINKGANGNILNVGDPEYVGQLPKGIKVTANIVPLTQGITTTETVNNETIASTYYFTPQRGESFIGNRTHVINDRVNIAQQYSIANIDANTEVYSPNNPNGSELMKPIPPPNP
jgi:hypothetical protein